MENAETIVTINNVKAPNYVSVYSNNVAFSLNFFDLSMTFGEMSGVENGIGQVDQSVRVVMSTAHAKLFALLLMSNVNQYEKQFGQISLPPADSLPKEFLAMIKGAAEAHESE